MNIQAIGKYSKHIALFAKLLRLDHLRVSYEKYEYDDILDKYYEFITQIINKETGFGIHPGTFALIELNNPSLDNAQVLSCDNLWEAENNFITLVANIIDLSLQNYIENTIKHLIRRDMKDEEYLYHNENNKKHKLNIFTWIAILNVCPETQSFDYRKIFIDAMRKLPRISPRIAVLFYGHIRHNEYNSHLPLITAPYTDVFFHTWSDRGYKNTKNLIQTSWLCPNKISIDQDTLIETYKPKKYLIENNDIDKFSVKHLIKPLFLYSGQAKDDASRYINSQLYSAHKAFTLAEDYEKEMGFKYDAIFKIRFDFKIAYLDLVGLLEDIQTDSLYFPSALCNNHAHYGGGGGCISCDNNIIHERHTNDFCDLWFYGKRDFAQKACEVFLHGTDILLQHHEQNLAHWKQSQYVEKNGCVYIKSMHDIETKYVCMYPERLLREHLAGICCKSSRRLSGQI